MIRRCAVLGLGLFLAGCSTGQWARENARLTCPPERLGLGPMTIGLPADHGRYMAIRDPRRTFYLVHNPSVPGGVGELRSRIFGFPETREYHSFAALFDGYSRETPGEQQKIFERLGPYTLYFGEHFETEYAAVEGRCTVRYTS